MKFGIDDMWEGRIAQRHTCLEGCKVVEDLALHVHVHSKQPVHQLGEACIGALQSTVICQHLLGRGNPCELFPEIQDESNDFMFLGLQW